MSQSTMLTFDSLDERVPRDYSLRINKRVARDVLEGRATAPLEHLLQALLLISRIPSLCSSPMRPWTTGKDRHGLVRVTSE